MKRVGIITVSRTFNFGAELQAYSLQYKLNQLGFDTELIDYLYYKNKRYRRTKASKSELYFKPKDKIRKYILYHFISPLIDYLLPLIHSKTRKRYRNFKRFHNEFIRFSNEYKSINELYNAKHEYDVFITGSDQVWNPATFSSLKPYLLDFAPLSKKRIAYASSFGVSNVSNEYVELYSKLFSQYYKIGVREQSGVDLIKKIANRNAEVVLDPTLLLNKEEWEIVTNNIKPQIEGSYILIYDLHPSSALLEVARKIQKKLKIPMYRICKRSIINSKYSDIINIESAGPAEFVAIFKNASFVITNSFHGTAFSVNFNIPFLVILKTERNNNNRITYLLNVFNLNKCIIWENSKIDYNENTEIDFNNTNVLLLKLRSLSLNFLLKSIKE
jgi:hypothetical protein